MGNDGGSIPKRIELVKEKKKKVKPDQNALTIATWFFCALSKRVLREPIVACRLGKLYNKDAIIEFLLNKSAYGDGDIICSHISGLKDLTTLKLTPNPAFKETSNANTAHFEPGIVSPFICPITRKEMNGKSKFVYIEKCGCVFSEQGLKEVPSSNCLQCAKPFTPENIITINPSAEEQESLKGALLEKKIRAKEKKDKKKQKASTSTDEQVVKHESSNALGTSTTLTDTVKSPENNQIIHDNKRKLSDEDVSELGNSKRIAVEKPKASTTTANVVSGSSAAAAVNKKVKEQLANSPTKAKQSKAIQSIYSKKSDSGVSDSYLVKAKCRSKRNDISANIRSASFLYLEKSIWKDFGWKNYFPNLPFESEGILYLQNNIGIFDRFDVPGKQKVVYHTRY
ncbi:3964_t:CDS:2 [Ambispora gerdemannii]|uniref:3964_t:CDS:1 n=1 Tax=Ambispora gerdemannii TaxID=144530 RepID=A0A9N9AQ81_9GLOM|nr:3964_t:CDS:2 [Ambispora gerdemannii]